MRSLFVCIYTYVYALLFSLLEIEIEGENGWCKKIPTFTIKKGIFKNFTFYHIIMNVIVILTNIFFEFLHNGFNINSLLYSIFYVTLWFLTEDFLWFVLNPFYTLKKYNKDSIIWHSNQLWILGMPMHNYICFTIMGSIAYFLRDENIIKSCFFLFILTAIIIKASPIYHNFYLKQKRHKIF